MSSTVVSQLLERSSKSPVLATLSPTEIVIEACSPKCENPSFPPLKEFLRGRWDLHRFPAIDMHEAVSRMPGPIPGIRIGVDPVNRTCRRFDSLELEEFDELWRKLVEHGENFKEVLSAEARGRRWPETIQRYCTDTTIKTWLHWCRQLVNSNSAVHVRKSAQLPSLEEIATMPGKTQFGQYNDYISYPQFREDFNEYGQPKPGVLHQSGIAAQVPSGAGDTAGLMDLASVLAMLQRAGFTIHPPRERLADGGEGAHPSGQSQPPQDGNSGGMSGGQNPGGKPRSGGGK